MSKSEEAKARELRLAAKLRENLKRRKGQAKARDGRRNEAGEGGSPPPDKNGKP
jgi:hypothetical protein